MTISDICFAFLIIAKHTAFLLGFRQRCGTFGSASFPSFIPFLPFIHPIPCTPACSSLQPHQAQGFAFAVLAPWNSLPTYSHVAQALLSVEMPASHQAIWNSFLTTFLYLVFFSTTLY